MNIRFYGRAVRNYAELHREIGRSPTQILARLNELGRPFEMKISSALPTFLTNIKDVRLYNRKAEWSLVSRDLK